MYGLGDLSKSDNESKECVICMTNPRDTCVLPCRHVCCCAECANTLRLQTDKCPVCRKPITELVYLTINPDYLNVQVGPDGSKNVEMQPLCCVCCEFSCCLVILPCSHCLEVAAEMVWEVATVTVWEVSTETVWEGTAVTVCEITAITIREAKTVTALEDQTNNPIAPTPQNQPSNDHSHH